MASLDPVFDSLRRAQEKLACQTRRQKDEALLRAADAVDAGEKDILAANALDLEKARESGMKEALLDRLFLDKKRAGDIAAGIRAVAGLDDPVGKVRAGWTLPNGLFIEQITVPLGVAAIIYESRPNVTADAFSLAYKAGCSILLRGSSSALRTNRAIVSALKAGLAENGLPDAVALAGSGGRDEVDQILAARGKIDVALPRGGRDLIRRVVENARVPVIETGEGNCHIFVDKNADTERALDIIENAKTQRPGACNAVETVLIHRDIAAAFAPRLAARLAGKVELRCDKETLAFIRERGGAEKLSLKEALEEDWETEYLDYILAVKSVSSTEEAIAHINRYGTRHSEAILTGDLRCAGEFCRRVDAACVYVNASTRFTDGGQFGFGAELGISTQKFHARGPMGLDALTGIKYRITGSGQIRE